MKNIKDVICAHASYDDMYELENSFYGKVVISEDQSFEGIITDYYQEESYLVIGHVEEENVLEMMRVAQFNKELPKLYRGKKEGNKFYGDLYARTKTAEFSLGECKISFLDPDFYRDMNLDGEVFGLESSVRKFKTTLGSEALDFISTVKAERGKTYFKKNTQN